VELSKTIRREQVPAEFRRYLIEGDHWRFGKRVHGERAIFRGLALHRSGNGDDGQDGPRQFDASFLEYLEQSLAEGRIGQSWRTAAARHAKVEQAMREIQDDRPDEIAALRYYLQPQGRRALSVVQQADHLRMSTETLRRAALRAIGLVWEEIGCVW